MLILKVVKGVSFDECMCEIRGINFWQALEELVRDDKGCCAFKELVVAGTEKV